MARPSVSTFSLLAAGLLVVAAGLLAVVAGLLAACSRPEEPNWPTRNYSGIYAARARVVSNSCEAPVFAPGDTLLVTVRQTRDNRARVDLSPVVSVTGAFRGDRLEANAAVEAPPFSPPSAEPEEVEAETEAVEPLTARRDSLRYRLALDFEAQKFEGSYRVEQPPLGGRLEACSQEFELEGEEVVKHPPAEDWVSS